MPWLWSRESPYETARAMIGAKAGDRVLVVGALDAGLAADVGLVTGLNGRTVAVDPSPGMPARIEAAAARAGALVEIQASPTTAIPADAGAFDIVIVQLGLAAHSSEADATLAEAGRLARPGGRVLVVEGVTRSGWIDTLTRAAGPAMPGSDICDRLARAGLRAARVLAETGGVTFVEAIKARV